MNGERGGGGLGRLREALFGLTRRPAGEARLLPRQADLNKTKRSSGEAGFLSLGPPCSPRCTLCNSRWTSQLESCESLTAGWDTFPGSLYLLLGLSRV